MTGVATAVNGLCLCLGDFVIGASGTGALCVVTRSGYKLMGGLLGVVNEQTVWVVTSH